MHGHLNTKKERQMGYRKYFFCDTEFYLYSYGMGNCWWFLKGCVFLFFNKFVLICYAY